MMYNNLKLHKKNHRQCTKVGFGKLLHDFGTSIITIPGHGLR
jgi:hypothetical protein